MISNVLSRFHHWSFILSLQWRVPGSAQSSVSKSPRFHTGGGLQSGGHDLSRLWPCCRSVCALNPRIFTSLFLSADEQRYLFIESTSGGEGSVDTLNCQLCREQRISLMSLVRREHVR